MSLANEDSCRRKSIEAVNEVRVRLQRKSDAPAFSSAALQPEMPPASISLACIFANLGFVAFWQSGQPQAVAAPL